MTWRSSWRSTINLGFIYLQQTASAEETIEGKMAFEAYSHRHGVKIENKYHADKNGIFKAYKWIDTCKWDGQGMTFAAVNAHHQNNIAERRIRELQELARAMLTHAHALHARWSDAITANLWPCAIRNATSKAINHTPSMQDANRRSPIELFSNSKLATNPKQWKPFGCPTYVVLSNELQSSRPFHKRSQRLKAGIYLGRSPQHGQNVALVMDRDMALVSPQFHVAYDATFDTVKGIRTKSSWQLRAGFVSSQKEPATKDTSSPPTTGSMAGGGRKRKRHTSNDRATAGEPEPSREKEPAAANVGDDGPPIPNDATHTGNGAMGSAPEPTRRTQTSRFRRTIKPTQKILEAMCTEISHSKRRRRGAVLLRGNVPE